MSGEASPAARASEIANRLKAMGSERNRQGMARFGINSARAAGVSVREVRSLAREIGTDHDLALALWETGLHEARILATIVADPERMSDRSAESWALDLDSWDVTDQLCQNLLWRTRLAWTKAEEWADRPETYVKRAAFALMAVLAAKRKDASSFQFISFLPLIRREALDGRRHVEKGVRWALKNIAKRDEALRQAALDVARELRHSPHAPSRRVGAYVLKLFPEE